MKNTFFDKKNLPHSIMDLSVDSLMRHKDLIKDFSMLELDSLYKKHYGDYSLEYPSILEIKIQLYDKSSEVNSFLYNGKEYWFEKSERVGLMNLANCSRETMSLVLGEEIVELSTDKVKSFLTELELYAAKCFVNTSKHLNAIKSLETTEEIVNYDYTSGYPERITLTNE